MQYVDFITSRGGGIGRRAGFRIQWAHALGGSSPPLDTKLISQGRLLSIDRSRPFWYDPTLYEIQCIIKSLLGRSSPMVVVVPSKQSSKRRIFGTDRDLIPLPDLVEVQRNSYKWFFQNDVEPEKRSCHGLQELFLEIFPIESYDGSFALEFVK